MLSPGVTFLLEHAGREVGIVAGQPDAVDPHIVHLMAMWVRPEVRGSGGADALVTAACDVGAAKGATIVCLDVIKSERSRDTVYTNGTAFRSSGCGDPRAKMTAAWRCGIQLTSARMK
jgi:GNAT superfamily N-acetyltransferase